MRILPLSSLTLLFAVQAAAQAPAPAAPQSVTERPGPEPPAPILSGGADLPPSEVDTQTESRVHTEPELRSGFSTGLRIGAGLPLGKAGQDPFGAERDLADLTSWRAPLWVDVGYKLPGPLTLGGYVQVGVGGNGDACLGDCDWSDIRIGAQAQFQFAPGAVVDPWLGVGLGYEWLSYRVLLSMDVVDAEGVTRPVRGRVTERFGGPELTLQGGLDFQVEDALRVGPFATASFGQYMTDSFNCQLPAPLECPNGSSIDGAGFHSWIGFGLRGAYVP